MCLIQHTHIKQLDQPLPLRLRRIWGLTCSIIQKKFRPISNVILEEVFRSLITILGAFLINRPSQRTIMIIHAKTTQKSFVSSSPGSSSWYYSCWQRKRIHIQSKSLYRHMIRWKRSSCQRCRPHTTSKSHFMAHFYPMILSICQQIYSNSVYKASCLIYIIRITRQTKVATTQRYVDETWIMCVIWHLLFFYMIITGFSISMESSLFATKWFWHSKYIYLTVIQAPSKNQQTCSVQWICPNFTRKIPFRFFL